MPTTTPAIKSATRYPAATKMTLNEDFTTVRSFRSFNSQLPGSARQHGHQLLPRFPTEWYPLLSRRRLDLYNRNLRWPKTSFSPLSTHQPFPITLGRQELYSGVDPGVGKRISATHWPCGNFQSCFGHVDTDKDGYSFQSFILPVALFLQHSSTLQMMRALITVRAFGRKGGTTLARLRSLMTKA